MYSIAVGNLQMWGTLILLLVPCALCQRRPSVKDDRSYPDFRFSDTTSGFAMPGTNKDFALPQPGSYQVSSLPNFNPSTGQRSRPSYHPRPYQANRTNEAESSRGPVVDPLELAVANASNMFGFDLYPYAIGGKQNVLYSPLSLSTALAMLYMGTRGATKKEMQRTLRYEQYGLDDVKLHPAVQSLTSRLSSDPSTTFDMVNLILVQTGYALGKEYQDSVIKYYQAALQNVDFSREGEQALNRMNEFVAHRTKNKVPQALDSPLDPTTKAFLMNVIYFKGEWQTRFDQRFTRPSTFYNRGEVPRTVPMMYMKSKLPFAVVSSADAYALELPYEGGRVSTLLILPKSRQGLPALERKFMEHPQAFLDRFHFREVMVDLSLPRFSLSDEFQVKDALRSLGMGSAFSAARADLSGISRDLYVSRVVHRAAMEVNEEGSEASAFSGIATGIRIGGPPAPLFTVDHPFLFLVRDRTNGAVLFMGRVYEL